MIDPLLINALCKAASGSVHERLTGPDGGYTYKKTVSGRTGHVDIYKHGPHIVHVGSNGIWRHVTLRGEIARGQGADDLFAHLGLKKSTRMSAKNCSKTTAGGHPCEFLAGHKGEHGAPGRIASQSRRAIVGRSKRPKRRRPAGMTATGRMTMREHREIMETR